MRLLQVKKGSTYFQMLAEIIHDPPESDPFLYFLMFQAPFRVSLVAFSFKKFHYPQKKITQTREPHRPLTHRSLTTRQVNQHKIEYTHTYSRLKCAPCSGSCDSYSAN